MNKKIFLGYNQKVIIELKGIIVEKNYYLSADGKTKIAYFVFEDKVVPPKAVLQVAHGMKETLLRYIEFAEFFTKNGYVVVGNDALGHGETSTSKDTDGFFAKKNGHNFVVRDLKKMTDIAKERYPNLPVYLFGHSMGSFFARYYAGLYPNAVDGIILSGTSAHVSGTRFGLFMMGLLKKIKGPKTHLAFIDKIMTGKYFKYIDNPESEFEWVTSDLDFLKRAKWDDKAQMPFSVSAYYDMVKTLLTVNKNSWCKKYSKDTPVLLISGAQDPVGQYGNGVCKVYSQLEKQKIKCVDLILYGEGRHALFYEIEKIKERFLEDTLIWLNDKVKLKNEQKEKELND